MQGSLKGSVQKCLCQPGRKGADECWDFCSEEQQKKVIYNISIYVYKIDGWMDRCENAYPLNNSHGVLFMFKRIPGTPKTAHTAGL